MRVLSMLAIETVVPVDRLPTELGTKLDAHVGECNVVAFNPLGTQMATGPPECWGAVRSHRFKVAEICCMKSADTGFAQINMDQRQKMG